MIHPESGIGSTKKGNGNRNAVSAGLFWTNCKSVSTTEIAKVQSSVQAWSLQSGMSSRSMGGGLSFPIGKATVGAKAGFEREQSGEHVSEEVTDKVHFTVVHTVPTVQINLNETTVLLSPDAESDIKKLRKGRKFSDLLSFLDKYGKVVPRVARSLVLTQHRDGRVPKHHAWRSFAPHAGVNLRGEK